MASLTLPFPSMVFYTEYVVIACLLFLTTLIYDTAVSYAALLL